MDERALIEALLAGDQQVFSKVNRQLEKQTAEERAQWALQYLPGSHILSSSFGIQGAVMLHLLTQAAPEIPVILIDTGYLFPETHQFVDELKNRLQLNLKVYRAHHSAAWQEARFGRLWEKGRQGIERYNQINKVEPMQRALKDLEVGTWFAGLRRQQSESRGELPVLRIQGGRFKLHPIIDWTNRDVHRYLNRHSLPYHPLWEQGYVSVGDSHTTRPLIPGMLEEETRFFGLKRECGLHE